MTAWLDENCGADGWAMTPSGMRGVLNDAVSIYFADVTLASAFVARWCVGTKSRQWKACSRCGLMNRRPEPGSYAPDAVRWVVSLRFTSPVPCDRPRVSDRRASTARNREVARTAIGARLSQRMPGGRAPPRTGASAALLAVALPRTIEKIAAELANETTRNSLCDSVPS